MTTEAAAPDDDAQAQQREAVQTLVRIVRHHVGDASPRGVDQGATVSRRGLATVAVANGGMDCEQFGRALRAAREHGHLVRFQWDDRERWTLPDPALLRRIQREAGERGDGETVGRAHRALAQLEEQ